MQHAHVCHTADAKAVKANLKNEDEGSGKYFPILAANQFTPDGKFINGVYVPHVAALQFEGPYEWKKVCSTVSRVTCLCWHHRPCK